MKTLVVAGTFSKGSGKGSILIAKMFSHYPGKCTIYNGGDYNYLQAILESVIDYDVVFWFANVDNSLPELRNIKEINPRCILITSKRNGNDKYCFEELINRALQLKANLVFEFFKETGSTDLFSVRVFDPLGNVWCNRTTDLQQAIYKAYWRITKLIGFKRVGSTLVNEHIDFDVENRFVEIIHEKAEILHSLIVPPEVIHRFLGNASFRCVHGFPSFKDHDYIVVSRRNVNKSGITKDDFVPVKIDDNKLYAYGQNKPSVDTPIQILLYKYFPGINYMLHSHVYIKDAPSTKDIIPCGALEEVGSILALVKENNIDIDKNFAVNLLGHGSIVFAASLDYFDTIEYVKRDIPEFVNNG